MPAGPRAAMLPPIASPSLARNPLLYTQTATEVHACRLAHADLRRFGGVRPACPWLPRPRTMACMSSHNFADFLEQLQASGQLDRITDTVRAELEAARRAAESPQALLLGEVADRDFPLAVHLFATPERVCRAFRAAALDEPAGRLAQALEGGEPGSWLDRLAGDRPASFKKAHPRMVRSGPCQQIVRLGGDVDLARLPAPTLLVEGESAWISAARLVTRPPGEDRLHVGRYDFRVTGRAELAACWAPYQEPARILAEYRRRGQPMPVAIVLGGDPLDLLVASGPLDAAADVFSLAGYLKGSPCELVAARRIDLPVPADAEMVLEGSIDPNRPVIEAGWAVDAMGQPRPLRPAPAVRVEALTHRVTPVFPAILPGMEARTINRSLAQVFLPLLRRQLTGLVDLELPTFGAGQIWALASIDKTYPGQARQFAKAFWSLPQMVPARFLVVVDHQVDVHQAEEVWTAVSRHTSPAAGIELAEAPPEAFLAEPSPGRMLFDATARLDGEEDV
ncbi:MAG: UbiD family decarboxylase domain-containing protein [Thermoguttaceae bacterium]|jgi:4-hydroxy-3-polyprenylbenzoate decarboxylase